MKKLVYTINTTVERLYIGNSYRDMIIQGRIYQKKRTFLGYDLSPTYSYTINIPLVKNPLYDGEYSTNRILKSYAKTLKQELKDKIQEFKEKDRNDR